MRLAVLALAGACIAAATWCFLFVPVPRLPLHGDGAWAYLWASRLRFLAFLGPTAVGLGLDLWAERRFKAGFAADAWSEAELAPVRRLVQSRIWLLSPVFALTGWIYALFGDLRMAWAGMAILLLQPLNVAGRLRQIVTPKMPAGAAWSEWRSFGPIRSQHWGEREV